MTQGDLPGMGQWSSVGPYLNPQIMRWARERRGLSVIAAAAKVGVTPSRIIRWEAAADYPTVPQARRLAHVCKRPFMEFFLGEPPKLLEPRPIQDFRTARGKAVDASAPDFRDFLIWVDARRDDALDLHLDLRGEPPSISAKLHASLRESPEEIAAAAGVELGMAPGSQTSMPAHKFPGKLRAIFEHQGIITLRVGKLGQFGARGVCFASKVLPAIVFGNEAPAAQAFTLAHELGHVLLNCSGIIAPYARRDTPRTEEWCDKFAAAFLMPQEAVASQMVKFGISQGGMMRDFPDEVLSYMATYFRVSEHAMLIRLLHLNYVDSSYYWDIKRPQFDAYNQTYKSRARSKHYASRYISKMGRLYTGLVMEAWDAGMITEHHASEYMEINNLKHLDKVREMFAQS